jgi:hypothetical protein
LQTACAGPFSILGLPEKQHDNAVTLLTRGITNTYGMCNEVHLRLKCLHRLVQFSHLFSGKGSERPLSYRNMRAMRAALKPVRLLR